MFQHGDDEEAVSFLSDRVQNDISFYYYLLFQLTNEIRLLKKLRRS